MGCSHSKLDDSEVVLRCKKRKHMMKQAVSHRKDFAVAHLAYLDALSKIGSALLHFAKENGILNEPPYTVESPRPSSTILTTAATTATTTTAATTSTASTSNTTANTTNTTALPLPLSSSHPSSSATSSSSFSPHQSDHQSSSPHHHHDDDDDDSCSSSLSPSPSPSPSPSYSSSPLSSHGSTPPSTPPPIPPLTPLISPIEATSHSTPPPPSQPSSSSPQKSKSKPSPPPPRSRPPPTPSNHRASAASVDSDLPNSGFFSPAYSDVVVKEEGGDGFFPAYSSSPPARPLSSGGISSPASPEQTSGWDYWNFFDHTIPYHHLHEPITLDQPEERGAEGPPRKEDLELVREKEGIPDLEEEEDQHHHQQRQQKQQKQQKQQQTQEEGKEQKEEVKVEEKKEEESAPPAKEAAAEIVVEEVAEKPPVVPSVETGESKKSSEDKKSAVIEKEEQASTDEKEVAAEVNKKEEKKVATKELAVVTAPKDKDLSEVLKLVSDQFALASAGGKDVSLLLETQRVHHHSSILDLRDSCQVLNVITFSWVSKIPSISISKDLAAASDTTESGIEGSHALTLESLYAWEKKLYNEVKDGERLRILFDRKCKQLRSQDVRGEDQHIIDKTRAAAKNLDSRLTVALRAVHCISVRVQKLTSEELYPQLEEIIAGLMQMWRVMQECYRVQQQIAVRMSDNMKTAITTAAGGNELSDTHRRATMELESELNNWHDCHMRWLESQLHYVHTLFEWLRLCHLPSPEDEVDLANDPGMSPYWLQNSPICDLVTKWRDALHRLKKKDEAIDSISNFATVLHSLQVQQYEELQQKQRLLDLQRKETRMISYSHYDDSNSNRKRDGNNSPTRTTAVEDRQLALSSFKSLLDAERKRHTQAVQERHYTTLTRFKENLPTLFQSMTDFAAAAFDEYKSLTREESSHSDDGEISDTSED